MKAIHYLLTAAIGLALGGCATSGDVRDVGQIRTMSAQGGTRFTQALATEYRSLAIEEADAEHQTGDAGYFARKGMLAGKGDVVLPAEVVAGGDTISRWGHLGPVIVVPRGNAAELQAARGRLVAFLDGGGRNGLPVLAAHAQGFFECWVEEAWEGDVVNECRDGFLRLESQFAMTTAAAPPPPPAAAAARVTNSFQVFFDFDRSDISATAAQIIEKAAAAAKQGKLTRITLTGHTDAAGTEAYNQALSERRAAAVKQLLIKDGLPTSEITAVGVGKAGQLVPTADGVREPQNRRTEILLH